MRRGAPGSGLLALDVLSKMKRRTIAILTLTLAAALAISWPFIRMVGRADRFIKEGTRILGTGEDHPGIVEIRLKSGDSFRALIEHSCCTGAGFDAVVLQSSDGSLYRSRNNYCGEEGFHAALTESKIGSLPELESYLLAHGYTKIGQNTAAQITAAPPSGL